MFRVILLILCALSMNTHASPKPKKPAVSAEKLVAAIQKQYNSTNSITFNFEQDYKHPFLTVLENSEGQVFYDRALGNMLWSYTEPKNKQKKFYINGTQFIYYLVGDKIAYEHNCYQQDTLSASITFLQGVGNLKDSFLVSLLEAPTPNPSLQWLKLSPKEKNAPVKHIYLGVKNGSVVESVVEDPSGGKNHFKFKDFKTTKIDKSVFVFTPPKGVVVEPMPNVQCPKVPKKAGKTASPKKTGAKKG